MAGKRKGREHAGSGGSSRSFPGLRVACRPLYKLLALDLDGTLLNHAGIAHEADLAAVRSFAHAE